MIKENTVTIEESLKKNINRPVIAKLRNGRALSGVLSLNDGVYTIQLGIQHLAITPENLAKPVTAN